MRTLLIFLWSILLAGCMTAHVDVAQQALRTEIDQRIEIIRRVDYDPHGRPFFGAQLNHRPSAPGEQFTLVRYGGSRAVESYDIVVRSEEGPDLMRPIEVIYRWTGEGFQGGMAMTQGMTGFSGSVQELGAYLVVRLVPVAVGGIVGFAVGVVASIPEAAAELKKVIVNARETIVSYTHYDYDARIRISLMRMYVPGDPPREVVRTKFYYENDGAKPLKAEVTSFPERIIRTIP